MSVTMNGNTFATWEDVRKEMFTPEEIAESNLRVALIGELVKARKERGLSQKQLEELTGVKQQLSPAWRTAAPLRTLVRS